MTHRTARLNEHRRLLLAPRVAREGSMVATAARGQGVSSTAGHLWPCTSRQAGAAGLTDRSARPNRSSTGTA